MLCAGQVYRAGLKVGDGTVAPLAATLTITLPDQSTVIVGPDVSAFGTEDPELPGDLYYDYLLADAGLHSFGWVTTGPGTAPPPNFVSVRRYASILSMEDAKDHLNMDRARTKDDAELSRFMMAATEVIESKIGICVPRVFTDELDFGGSPLGLVLPRRPVISVQRVASVWAGGPVWDNVASPGTLAVNADAGIVYQPSGWTFWWGPWTATCLYGRAEIAEHWAQAAREQLRHLWQTQRGSQPPAVLQNEEIFSSTQGFTFSVPRRVLELLGEDMVPAV